MLLDRMAPALFVLLWSTGWIAAGYVTPYAQPLEFLVVRYAAAAVVLLVICFAFRAAWPTTRSQWGHAIFSGVLLHGIYLGGIWWAIAQGVPAALSGLIAALQPLMTAMVAPYIVGERLTGKQWLGIMLGLSGLLIAIVPRLFVLEWQGISGVILPLLINIGAMAAVTGGTIYQKRYLQAADLRTTAMLQYIGALAFTLPMAWLLEDMRIQWNIELTLALLWSVFGLSIGAIALLLYLIRRGQVSRAASLIYLVPPTVAVQAWLLFGDRPTPSMIIGTSIVVFGVYLASQSMKINARGVKS